MKQETQARAIVGRYEIGQMFGVTRQGVTSIIEHPDAPAPICTVGKSKAPLFWRRDMQSFKDRRDRQAAAAEAEPAAA